MLDFLDSLKFLPDPPLLRTPQTIQILLIRQTHDYAIFRTEESREINTAVIPKSFKDPIQTTRVAFLASKQKAAESRAFASIAKEYYKMSLEAEKQEDKDGSGKEEYKIIMGCELKDALCRKCPRCVLFGALNLDSQDRWNIKHRVEYSTAFSLEPYQLVTESITFNAVTESTNSTDRALNSVENIEPLVSFPSIVTLNSPTKEEFILMIKTLLACKSYGAEGRTRGDVINYISGIVFGNEELLTPLEYCLELSEIQKIDDSIGVTCKILEKYRPYSTFPDELKILTKDEVTRLIDEVRTIDLPKYVHSAYMKSMNFANLIQSSVGNSKDASNKTANLKNKGPSKQANKGT